MPDYMRGASNEVLKEFRTGSLRNLEKLVAEQEFL